MVLQSRDDGFLLSATDETGVSAECYMKEEKQEAHSPQHARIVNELSKTGGTIFVVGNVELQFDRAYFIPAARVAQWRRDIIERMLAKRRELALQRRPLPMAQEESYLHPKKSLDYSANVSNGMARSYYQRHGVGEVGDAFEISPPERPLIMTCRHCIRYSLGGCVKHGGKQLSVREPLFLSLPDGRRFRLSFDCANCEMKIFAEKS